MKNPELIKVKQVLSQDMFDLAVYHEFDINMFNIEKATNDVVQFLPVTIQQVLEMNINQFVEKYKEALRVYEELWSTYEAYNDELHKSF